MTRKGTGASCATRQIPRSSWKPPSWSRRRSVSGQRWPLLVTRATGACDRGGRGSPGVGVAVAGIDRAPRACDVQAATGNDPNRMSRRPRRPSGDACRRSTSRSPLAPARWQRYLTRSVRCSRTPCRLGRNITGPRELPAGQTGRRSSRRNVRSIEGRPVAVRADRAVKRRIIDRRDYLWWWPLAPDHSRKSGCSRPRRNKRQSFGLSPLRRRATSALPGGPDVLSHRDRSSPSSSGLLPDQNDCGATIHRIATGHGAFAAPVVSLPGRPHRDRLRLNISDMVQSAPLHRVNSSPSNP